jgi:RNA polymerase sigma-70 factor (ECF subfamily)
MMKDDRFRSLYQRFYLRIVRFFVRSFHLSEDDARDLAQDTFLRFYKAMDEYRGDAEWAFLETTARNVAYNRIRSQNAAKRRGQHVDVEDPAAGVPSTPPLDYAKQQEEAIRRRQLRDAIAELPPGQRQCIELQLDGFSYEETGRFLRISDDAVKSRIRDAKRGLRDQLGADPLLKDDES